MRPTLRYLTAGLTGALLGLGLAVPAEALPSAAALRDPSAAAAAPQAEPVSHWRHRHHRHYRGGSGFSIWFGTAPYVGVPYGYYGYRPRTYYAPPVYYRDYYVPRYPRRHYRSRYDADWIAYCSSKYRSFNPRTGMYLSYSGRYRPCR